MALIGHQVDPPAPATNPAAAVTLFWQALQDIPQPTTLAQDFQVRFDLTTPDGNMLATTTQSLLDPALTDKVWLTGQVQSQLHQVPLPDNLPAGDYHLTIALTRAGTGELVPFLDEATGLLTAEPFQLETTITWP